MIFNFDKYKLDIDVEATKSAYVKLPLVTENCTCRDCENYFEATKQFPEQVHSFFSSLGVDIYRSSEVFGTYDEKTKLYNYGGFYHIAGKILEQKEEMYFKKSEKLWEQNPNMVMLIADNFSVWFSSECSLVPDGFPEPHIQMDISFNVPYVLERPYFDSTCTFKEAGKIKEGKAVLTAKRKKKTLFGDKYIFSFTHDNKSIDVYVGVALFDFYEVGWSGAITFSGKKLISIR